MKKYGMGSANPDSLHKRKKKKKIPKNKIFKKLSTISIGILNINYKVENCCGKF